MNKLNILFKFYKHICTGNRDLICQFLVVFNVRQSPPSTLHLWKFPLPQFIENIKTKTYLVFSLALRFSSRYLWVSNLDSGVYGVGSSQNLLSSSSSSSTVLHVSCSLCPSAWWFSLFCGESGLHKITWNIVPMKRRKSNNTC